ncbi:MAG TPA: hypothetical protein VFV67_12425 [Actinophytocola sp.]|uniref:hypothetical protein n=1 Tax=Actinophytocola sp. TaxID=1872138 RepID=UPI002DBD8330|nr:hypothetical protein [Actinophytocola sp.]HEU5471452.1 hypothetical protein [Actinophytocola sp.]
MGSRGRLRGIGRAEPRFTRDVDVAATVTDDSAAEQLIHSVEHDDAERLATARLGVSPTDHGGQVIVDVLFASSGIEPEIVRAAEPIEILPGLTVPWRRPAT